LQGRRGLVWNVTCLDNGLSLLSTPMVLGSIPQWSTFDTPFSVPSGSCPAQQLQLNLDARSPSEQLVTGSMYYDDLQIVRASPPAPTAAESGTVTTSEPAAPDTAQSRSSEPAPGTAPPFAVDVPAPDPGIPPTTGAPAQ
jgi:hypothetical protein